MADSNNLNDIDGVPLYKSSDPYHFDFDNKPIKSLAQRDKILMGFINRNTKTLKDAAGNLGDLSTRLNQSIDPLGNLKLSAIDEANHNIANHTDGRKEITDEELAYYTGLGYSITKNPKFIRIVQEERDKLSRIESEANNIKLSVKQDNEDYIFNNGIVKVENSDTIECILTSDNSIKFNSKFPVEVAHRHYYGVEPISSDYKNYSINGISSFQKDSLRVYVNGFRVEVCSSDCANRSFSRYPTFHTGSPVWVSLYFSEDSDSASFSLSTAINSTDQIFVDYDVKLI
jgi:hypothetical protein